MDGIPYFYDQGVYHRDLKRHKDLKPENIMIHKKIAKIVDFGFREVINLKNMQAQGTVLRTSFYMAP